MLSAPVGVRGNGPYGVVDGRQDGGQSFFGDSELSGWGVRRGVSLAWSLPSSKPVHALSRSPAPRDGASSSFCRSSSCCLPLAGRKPWKTDLPGRTASGDNVRGQIVQLIGAEPALADRLHLSQGHRLGLVLLSTILDDFSRYIIAWKLCTTMKVGDVTETLDLAPQASGLDRVALRQSPFLHLGRRRMAGQTQYGSRARRALPPANAGRKRPKRLFGFEGTAGEDTRSLTGSSAQRFFRSLACHRAANKIRSAGRQVTRISGSSR